MTKNKSEKELNSSIKLLLRSFVFAKPFIGLYVLTLVVNAFFSIFSAMSIAIIKPIFEILFNSKVSDATQVVAGNNFFEKIKISFYNIVTQLILNPTDIQKTLINLGMLIIFLFIIKHIFKYWGSVINVKLTEGIVKDMRDILFRKLTTLSVDFFSKRQGGALITVLMSDISVLNTTTISTVTNIVRDFIEVCLYVSLLLAISPKLTLLAFSTSIVSFGTLRLAMKYIKRYSHRMQNALSDYTTALQETLYGIRVVKAYNAENHAIKRFNIQTEKYVKASVKLSKITSSMPSINEIFAILALCFVFYFGGTSVLRTELKADDLMLFLFTLFAVMSPITAIVNNVAQIQRGVVSAERLFEILDQEPSVPTGDKEIQEFKDKIEVKNVNFSYAENQVLKDVSFNIEKTKKVAFVGSSGSGKSTILDLIIRFYDPIEGSILIDGQNIKDLKTDSYRKLFGIVSQETTLFNDTIANNIRYGLTDIPMDQIIQAAKTANAYDFIMKLPMGFDSVIGERGVMLSGGERQRIAIARAMIRNPYIIIFDEATSSLDAESEKIVQLAINDSLLNRTAIIVAHRLSTIIDCDEIFVIDDGRIVERGSHQQLYNADGIYRKLYEIQFARQYYKD